MSELRTTTVRKYGCLPPLDWDEGSSNQLWLQNRFWNRLVEIEREHKETFFAITAEDSEVDRLDKEISALKARKVELISQKKKLKQKARQRVKTPEIDADIKVLTAKIKELVPQVKTARKAARERLKPKLQELEVNRKAAVKSARQEYAAAGLFWGNYNEIVNRYQRARQRAIKSGGELHFKRFDGTGMITQQLQGGRTAEQIFDTDDSQFAIILTDPTDYQEGDVCGRKHAGHRFALRIKTYGRGKSYKIVTLPLIMHRPLPDDCIVKEVRLNKRRVADQEQWTVVLTCSIPKPDLPEPTGAVTSVNFGWRQEEDGSLRVATIMRPGQPHFHIYCPAEIKQKIERVYEVRSIRDHSLNAVVSILKNMDWTEAPEDMKDVVARFRRTPKPSPASVVRVINAWDEHPKWNATTYNALHNWRERDKRYWREERHLHDRMTNRRQDLYRNEALKIVAGASAIIFENFDMSQTARLEDENGEKTQIPEAARHNRVIAAPSMIREAIRLQAGKRQIPIKTHRGKSTHKCSACGADMDAEDNHGQLYLTCKSCRTTMDQDKNACLTMLKSVAAE